MFVLDSVVKNIGYPYTLFLGRNLYKTFMETYSLVNDPIRRKLDELLKTWKEPVPGQSNLQPVFQPDVTRPIENALIRWRTMNIQRQQQDSKSQRAILRGGRPTPPQQNGRYQTPPTPGYPLQATYNGHPQVCRHLLPMSPISSRVTILAAAFSLSSLLALPPASISTNSASGNAFACASATIYSSTTLPT